MRAQIQPNSCYLPGLWIFRVRFLSLEIPMTKENRWIAHPKANAAIAGIYAAGGVTAL